MPEGMSPWAKDRRKTSTPATTRSLRLRRSPRPDRLWLRFACVARAFPSLLSPSLRGASTALSARRVRATERYAATSSRATSSAHRRHVGPVDVDHAQVHAVAARRARRCGSTSLAPPSRTTLAAVEQDQAVGELSREREVVQRREHRETALARPRSGGVRGSSIWWRRSSPVIGSSRTTTTSLWARARASTIRWRSPPESVATSRSRNVSATSRSRTPSTTRPVGARSAARRSPWYAVRPKRDVVEHRHPRRDHRVLGHERHPPGARAFRSSATQRPRRDRAPSRRRRAAAPPRPRRASSCRRRSDR